MFADGKLRREFHHRDEQSKHIFLLVSPDSRSSKLDLDVLTDRKARIKDLRRSSTLRGNLRS